jgi:hypothetical protein
MRISTLAVPAGVCYKKSPVHNGTGLSAERGQRKQHTSKLYAKKRKDATQMSEKIIQTQILKALGARRDVRLFRQNVGNGFMGRVVGQGDGIVTLENTRRVQFGLCPGSPDLVGWQAVTITPDMVGKKFAVFTGIEVKAPRGRVRNEQENFIRVLRSFGGTAGIARSVADAEALLIGGGLR